MKIQLIEKEPIKCIYCKSDNIQAETIDGGCLSRQVICMECDKHWLETFKFTGVITDEGEVLRKSI